LTYNPVSPALVERLRRICGPDAVHLSDSPGFARYSHDQTKDTRLHAEPEVVVFPSTTEHVQGILQAATEHRVPVTPRGAGSGLSGGAVPLHGGIVASVARMNRILAVDPASMTAVVQPGVVTNALDAELEPLGLFFAGYPMSEEFCYIGGNVAENAGGGRAVKYGVTGRYVTGLEVVRADGTVMRVGGKLFKNVTGYDLVSLFVGSEGTLGFITEVTLRLMPRPRYRGVVFVLLPDVEDALAIVNELLITERLTPSALEFFDDFSLHQSCRVLGESIPYRDAGAALLIEADSHDEGVLERERERIQAAVRRYSSVATFSAETEDEVNRFWRIRKQVPWSIMNYSSPRSSEDLVVPIAHIAEFVREAKRIGLRYDTPVPCFGHAGDGNIHTSPLRNPNHDIEHWHRIFPQLQRELYQLAHRLGGTLSGEHGIGHKRRAFLSIFLDETALTAMRSLKQTFDPLGILNPGKVVDLEPEV
jgi:glycolate oxidase